MNRLQKLHATRIKVDLQKAGSWGDVGNWANETFIGGNPLDPNTRGAIADIALYSNPFSGVPTGINDISRHLYHGSYGKALGSLGMTALSFLPGLGSAGGKALAIGAGEAAAKAGTRAAVHAGEELGGKFITNAMRGTGSKTLERAAGHMDDFSRAGKNVIEPAQNKVFSGLQKVVPQKTTGLTWKSPVRSTVDAAIRNPIGTTSMGATMTGGVMEGMRAAPSAVAPAVTPAVEAPAPAVPAWAPPQNYYPKA
ncbi:MAG: hypothetical protein E6R03_03435 [Hyphomicrobiaceae bacterium]|nr:MAG: hypothetical protein E6R03_03435 [Hyphomicrobiaceae bacterium]